MFIKYLILLSAMFYCTFSHAQQRTREDIERGLSQMEKNGELRREGNRIIFLKISKGDTAFFSEMYRNMLKEVKDNPYTIAFEFSQQAVKSKNTVKATDTTKNYQYAQQRVNYNNYIKYDVVAFEATITGRKDGVTSPLQFDNISYNDGNGFSLHPSEFRAPSDGLYFFSLHLNWNGFGSSSLGAAYSAVDVVKNGGTSLWRGLSIAGHPQPTSTVINFSFSTKLKRGDIIKVTFLNILADYGAIPVLYGAKFCGYRITEF